MMTIEDKIQYWIHLSDEDIKTAKVMLRGGRRLYVGFMCHQVIEKIFKAAYVKIHEDSPPYTHKLSLLATQAGFMDRLTEEQLSFIMKLEPLNIEARYPDYKSDLEKQLTRSVCTVLLEQTIELQQWTKEQLL
jgi:HEPN domain-containing protein